MECWLERLRNAQAMNCPTFAPPNRHGSVATASVKERRLAESAGWNASVRKGGWYAYAAIGQRQTHHLHIFVGHQQDITPGAEAVGDKDR